MTIAEKNLQESFKIFEGYSAEKRELLIDLIEHQDERRACCDPYDCMHHEQCGEDGWYCTSCREGQELHAKIGEVDWRVWDAVRQIIHDGRQELFRAEREMIAYLEEQGDYAAVDRILES